MVQGIPICSKDRPKLPINDQVYACSTEISQNMSLKYAILTSNMIQKYSVVVYYKSYTSN